MDLEDAPEQSLNNLLNAIAEVSGTTNKHLVEIDVFDENNCKNVEEKAPNTSLVHTNDTDSSDDEDNRNYQDQRYNECGKNIKNLLRTSEELTGPSKSGFNGDSVNWKSTKSTGTNVLIPKPTKTDNLTPKHQMKASEEIFYTDPFFGMRIKNPLVSSAVLKERMVDRVAVPFSRIERFTSVLTEKTNWVIAGAVVGKCLKTSQKGNQFCIWTLSDLQNDLKTVGVFLFGSAYKNFWKTSVGVVAGILNPTVMEKKAGCKDEVSLSTYDAQKIMILGTSKDYGVCRSTKKNGEKCSAFVNTNRCEYCIYHVKQEYQKCSQRSELQSSFAGRGLTALQNKLLGKSELIYGGKSYMAIPATKSRKQAARDENRMKLLSGKMAPEVFVGKKQIKAAAQLEVTHKQRQKDLEILQKLGMGSGSKKENLNDLKTDEAKSKLNFNCSAEVTLEESRQSVASVLTKLKSKPLEKPKIETKKPSIETLAMDIPVLANFNGNTVDLSAPIPKRHVDRAKQNALKYVQRNGPIQKTNPNQIHNKRSKNDPPENEPETKKPKIAVEENSFHSERFKKMLALTSKNKEIYEEDLKEKYFSKMEMKEKMEEKMCSTYKIKCKAVRCLKCKYTSFSASDLCKKEGHPLKVFDGVKRFFKCGNCGNRTACLEVVPLKSCANCGSSKWERTAMMKERTVQSTPTLSIRGGEQKFVNSVVTDANIDLMLPLDG